MHKYMNIALTPFHLWFTHSKGWISFLTAQHVCYFKAQREFQASSNKQLRELQRDRKNFLFSFCHLATYRPIISMHLLLSPFMFPKGENYEKKKKIFCKKKTATTVSNSTNGVVFCVTISGSQEEICKFHDNTVPFTDNVQKAWCISYLTLPLLKVSDHKGISCWHLQWRK